MECFFHIEIAIYGNKVLLRFLYKNCPNLIGVLFSKAKSDLFWEQFLIFIVKNNEIRVYYSFSEFLFIFPRLSDQQFYLFTPECCWKSEIDISYFFPIFFLFLKISSYFSYFLPIFCFLGFLFPIFCSYFFSKIHETL